MADGGCAERWTAKQAALQTRPPTSPYPSKEGNILSRLLANVAAASTRTPLWQITAAQKRHIVFLGLNVVLSLPGAG